MYFLIALLYRLVIGLPAVINVFDQAQLSQPSAFSKAVVLFIKAVGKGFDGLTQVKKTIY